MSATAVAELRSPSSTTRSTSRLAHPVDSSFVRQLALVASLLSACAGSYTSVGYDVSRRSSGTVAPMMDGVDQLTGRAAIGFGTKRTAMEIVVNGHDLETSDDAWLSGSAGLELVLRLAHVGPVGAFVRGGPMRGILFDAATTTTTWGAGVAWGAGLELGTGGVHLVVDVHGEEQWFAGSESEATLGSCSLRSVAVGMRFGR